MINNMLIILETVLIIIMTRILTLLSNAIYLVPIIFNLFADNFDYHYLDERADELSDKSQDSDYLEISLSKPFYDIYSPLNSLIIRSKIFNSY